VYQLFCVILFIHNPIVRSPYIGINVLIIKHMLINKQILQENWNYRYVSGYIITFCTKSREPNYTWIHFGKMQLVNL
jgi:hypothetical protein